MSSGINNDEGMWEPLPKYGDLIELQDFADSVKNGGFIDYDGWGHWATEKQMFRGFRIRPSEFLKLNVPEGITHIMWFNK